MKTNKNTIGRMLTASLVTAVLAGQASAQSGSRSSGRSYQRQSSQQQSYQPNRSYQPQQQRAAAQQTAPQTRQQQLQQVARNNQTQVGLEGKCPVCVISIGKWVDGKASLSAAYDGKTYFFPDNGTLQTFLKDPVKYVPALGGDCTVCYDKINKRVPGNIRFATLHQNRLYLFPSDKERVVFEKSPQAFEKTDLAFDGKCIVCQVKVNKSVPGSNQFSAMHNGFRYLFPSDRERQVFLQSPEQYVAAVAKPMMNDSMHRSTMNKKMSGNRKMHDGSMMQVDTGNQNATQQVQFRGKTACAGCEFGVTPLGAPKELGLAVATTDGKVYVIEEGHTRWPQIYKGRFDGQQVSVSGMIVKTAGNVAWVKPTNLTVL